MLFVRNLTGIAARHQLTDRLVYCVGLAGIALAVVLLDERVGESAELVAALAEVLARMSPRTRRPIRFLNPEKTKPAPLAPESWPDSQPPAASADAPVAPVSPDGTWP